MKTTDDSPITNGPNSPPLTLADEVAALRIEHGELAHELRQQGAVADRHYVDARAEHQAQEKRVAELHEVLTRRTSHITSALATITDQFAVVSDAMYAGLAELRSLILSRDAEQRGRLDSIAVENETLRAQLKGAIRKRPFTAVSFTAIVAVVAEVIIRELPKLFP